MKARCSHGAPWFADCPWCLDEEENRQWGPNIHAGTFSWWRNRLYAEPDTKRERFQKVQTVKDLIDRALDDAFGRDY